MAVMQFVQDPKFHDIGKHIKRTYHYIRGQVKDGEVILSYISSAEMVTDPLTKSLLAHFPRCEDLEISHKAPSNGAAREGIQFRQGS